MSDFNEAVYNEIYNLEIYEQYVQIEKNDVVLDLGCSNGCLYLKNHKKDIDYMGIDGCIKNIKDFSNNLLPDMNPIILNLLIDKGIEVINFSWVKDSNLVPTITFSNLIKLIHRKIDFLKFDIEGNEKYIFEDLDLFKRNVNKFSGEIHFNTEFYPREEVHKSLEKFYSDDIDFKLYSLDPIEITDIFWENKNYYTEIIISGIVKGN